MYTLSRKVIIRKWGQGRHIGPFSLYRHGEETQQALRIQRRAKRMIGRFLSMRAAHPFLIYSI